MARGDGRVYQPRKDGSRLGVWYYEIFFNGRRKVGRGYPSKRDAENALKAERKRKARGEFVPPETERLTTGQLLDAYLEDLKDRGKKSVASVKCRIEHLQEAVGHVRAIDLRTADVEQYRKDRLAAGLNRATIDREVEVLRAAFRLSLRREQLTKVPYFPSFNTDHVRQGFFEEAEAEKIMGKLPEVLAEVVRFASLSGWRIGEILPLPWEAVDMRVREIRLGTSKNGRPRTLALQGALWELIMRRWRAREYQTGAGPGLSAFVFHRRSGRPVSYSSYRKAFVAARTDAGVEGRTTHDFRRTVSRDLRRAGVSETVCMAITGHSSPAMFRRYAIVATGEQEAAFAARATLLASERERAKTTKLLHLTTP